MSAGYTLAGRSNQAAPVVLHGRRLLLARGTVAVVVALVVGLFIRALPLLFTTARVVCRSHRCISFQLTPEMVRQHQAFGLSISAYAVYVVALNATFAAVYWAVAAVLVWRRSDERMALFSALALVTFGGATFTGALDVLAHAYPAWWWVVTCLDFLGATSIVLLAYLFPDGRLVPRWSLVLAVPWILVQGVAYLFPHSIFNYRTWSFALVWLIFLAGIAPAIVAQIYRYRHVSGPLQRQQTKVVVFGATVAGVGFLGLQFGAVLLSSFFGNPMLASMIINAATNAVLLLSPLSIGLAILRYRLWDVDAVINRTLVYATLTATLGVVYIGSVVGLIALLGGLSGERSTVAVAVATAIIAALFQPLRRRIQRGIDRRFYRRKYDAAQALAAFSARLRDEVELAAVSADLLAVVEETVQPAHASLWLRPPEDTA